MARPTKVQWLLDDLCRRLGICLSPAERARIEQDPPGDVNSFADVILIAEGIDPYDGDNSGLRQQVREFIVKHLKPKEDG